MDNSERKFGFKITVIGDGRVGKTSLIKKFTLNSFKQEYIKTIGAQFSTYDKEIDGNKIRLLFWDIAGQDDFEFLRASFFHSSKAAIIVFSLEKNELGKQSFKHITYWHEDVKKHCGDIPIVIFANKVDLVDQNNIDKFEIQLLANKLNILGYYLTSAKTGQGVIKAFNAIINELYDKYKPLSLVY